MLNRNDVRVPAPCQILCTLLLPLECHLQVTLSGCMPLQDEADDVAAYTAVLAEKEAAAQSAADYAARKQREVDDARAAELPSGVSISDMENGAASGVGRG